MSLFNFFVYIKQFKFRMFLLLSKFCFYNHDLHINLSNKNIFIKHISLFLAKRWRLMYIQRTLQQTICLDMICSHGSTTVYVPTSIKSKNYVQVMHFFYYFNDYFRKFIFLFKIIRSCILPVHGHAISRLRANETCQIPYQFRA